MSPLEKAIHNLGLKGTLNYNDKTLKLVCLIRTEDRRPFRVKWWNKSESYLIAVTENGHFLLRHSGGAIFKLDPLTKEEETIAISEKEFINRITWNE